MASATYSKEDVKKLHEYEDRYEELYGSTISVWYPWGPPDFIAAYEECFRENRPFDFHDPKWPWNPADELPPDAVI